MAGAGAMHFGGAVGDTAGHRRWLLIGLNGVLASCGIGLALGKDGLLPAALLGAFWSGFAMPLGVAIVADAYPIVATVVAWAGFRWARGRDELPSAPIQPDPEAARTST